jgi:hypothetical protein
MTLRTGLLMCLGLLALVSLGLYAALSQTGGIGVPGGKNAIEQAFKPYVDPDTLQLAQPRIAIKDGNDLVEMTLRTIAFKTKDGAASVALERISASIDAQRMTEGAIRFKAAQIKSLSVTLNLDALAAAPQGPRPTPRQLAASVERAYRAAFASMHVERLTNFVIDSLTIRLRSAGQEVAVGKGRLTLQPAGKAMQLSSALSWQANGAQTLDGESNLFVIGGPEQALEAALSVEIDTANLVLADERITTEAAKIELAYTQQAADDAVLLADAQFKALDLAETSFYPAERRFEGIELQGRYSAAEDIVSVSIKPFDLGQARASALAELSAASAEAQLRVTAQIEALRVDDLKRYWPQFLAKNARLWIAENITKGLLPTTSLTLDAPLDAVLADKMDRDALSLTFDMQDVTAHYRRPMPPLESAFGSAKMSLDDILLSVDQGQINGVDTSGSSIFITSFAKSPQRAEINLRVAGSSTGLAQVLDSEPLNYLSAYEVDPNALNGEFAGRALLKLPLLRDLLLDDIVLSARIDGQALSLGGLLKDEALQFERTVIELTQNAMAIRSDVKIDGARANLRWLEDFTGTSTTPTDLKLSGQIDPDGLARWLPGLAETMYGTVFFDSALLGRGSDIQKATITADLTPAIISVPMTGYRKEVGEIAEAYVSFSAADGQFDFDALTVKAPNLLVIGGGGIAQDGSTAALAFSTIEMPGLNASLNISKEGDAWLLAGAAQDLDVSPILNMFWAGELTQTADQNADETDTVVSVSLSLDTLSLLEGQQARKTRVLGSFKGSHVQQLNVFGQGPNDAPFTFTIEPIETGRRFLLASQSAGELANGLGMISTATGGQLMVQATSFERSDDLVLAGLMEMTGIRLLDTPILARLLGLGSLSGVADLARNRGINFETVTVPFELNGGLVTITNASAKGPALGLTANGQFLESLEKGDIRGVIVPSYTINSALGRVPIIGDALMGGQDTGLFGINYKISGALSDPELSVNPASVLTPGFLRRIFGSQKGQIDQGDDAPLTPQAAGQTQQSQ